MKTTLLKKYWPALFVLPWLLYYFFYVIKGNLVFVDTPYALMIDERADLIHIRAIQDSLQHFSTFLEKFFWKNPDPSHGFLVYAWPALVSFIPKFFFGDAALIFTHRMLSALLFVSSLLILSFGFIKNRLWALLLFFLIMGFPTINVFCFWPRCEAYMYFFTILFLFIQWRSRFSLCYPFIFLGIGLAARPGFLFYLPLFFLFPLFFYPKNWKRILLFSYFGVLIAQPHYLFPSNIFEFLRNYLTEFQRETGNRAYIDFSWWMENVITNFFPPRFYLGSYTQFLLWCFGGGFLLGLSSLLKPVREELKRSRREIFFWLGLILSSLLSLAFVLFTVHKGVNWYLQLYILLLFVGDFYLLDFLTRVERRLLWLALPLGVYVFFYFFQQFSFSPYLNMEFPLHEMVGRPELESHQRLKREYEKSRPLLQKISENMDRRVRVRIMQEQYQLESTPAYEIVLVDQPAPFYRFDPTIDFHIFYKSRYLPSNPENKTETGELPMREESVRNYLRYVVPEHGGECRGEDCLTAASLEGDLFIFFKKENEKVVTDLLKN